jgi:membrane protease YdiL (CAAX protease family)
MVKIARIKNRKRIKIGHPHAEIAPHTRTELGPWVALSLSAGFCEEFVFRGYLIWVFQPLFGLWGAATFSVVLFGVSHAYKGAKGILSTGAVGLFLTLVVLISGSLWPAIALHSLADIGSGLVAWLALRRVEDKGKMVAA